MWFKLNYNGRDHTYTHTNAERHPNSNAGADTDSVPDTDAHAVPVAKPDAYADRVQPFHLPYFGDDPYDVVTVPLRMKGLCVLVGEGYARRS